MSDEHTITGMRVALLVRVVKVLLQEIQRVKCLKT